jgi:hypothetical protein
MAQTNMHEQLQAIITVLSLSNLVMFVHAMAGQSLVVLSRKQVI